MTSHHTHTTKIFISIAGNIGTGKTTLTRLLSDKYGWQPHFEAVLNNPYLEDFYSDMKRWAFPIQIFFLNSRIRAHRIINQSPNSAVQDRSIYEDAHIFARNLYESGFMEKRDYETYQGIYKEICDHLAPPDLLIYLRKTLPNLKKNIIRRGRDYETKITEKYLENLTHYYEDWVGGYTHSKKLIIDSDDLDFVEKPGDLEKVSKLIFDCLDQKELFFKIG